MNTHRVEVLDRADDNAVVSCVADDLDFKFFPSKQGLLDQDLGGGGHVESPTSDGLEFLTVVGDASSCASERECGTDDQRIGADLLGDHKDLVDRVGGA